MAIEINPLNPGKNKPLLDALLAQADDEEIKTLYKQPEKGKRGKKPHIVNGEEVFLTHGLKKSAFGNKWWIIEEKVGRGSENTVVKALKHYYQKNDSDQKNEIEDSYELKDAQAENVIKIIKTSPKRNAETALLLGQHEYMQLRKIDENAEIFTTHNSKGQVQKVFLISTKAKGQSLETYLFEHPDLSFENRLKIIKLISEKVNELREKNIYHLDLKLENIFYDEKTNQIMLVDFGSSQNFDAKTGTISYYVFDKAKAQDKASTFTKKKGKSLKEMIERDEEPLDYELQLTTPHFDPIFHLENTPKEIDNYSLAGVFGCVLSDWSQVKNHKNYKEELPIFSIKNKKSVMALAATTKPDEKRYYFAALEKVSYSHDKEAMSIIIGGLNHLGKEEKESRSDLVNFEEILNPLLSAEESKEETKEESKLSPVQPKLRDSSTLDALKTLKMIDSDPETMIVPDFGNIKDIELVFPDFELEDNKLGMAFGVGHDTEFVFPYDNTKEEEKPTSMELPTPPETDTEKEKDEPLGSLKNNSNEDVPLDLDKEKPLVSSDDTHSDFSESEETSRYSIKNRDSQLPAQKEKRFSFLNENRGSQNDSEGEEKIDPEQEEKAALIKELKDYIQKIDQKKIQGTDNTNFRHGFWVMKNSRSDSRIANHGLAGKLIKELQTNKSIKIIFEKGNLKRLRDDFIREYRGKLDSNSKEFNPRPTIARFSRLNVAINAARNPKAMDELKRKQAKTSSLKFKKYS